MPLTDDVTNAIEIGKSRSVLRTLILIDETARNKAVHANFSYPCDTNPSLDSVTQLFDETFGKIARDNRATYCPTELAILAYIGRFKVTVVTKNKDGRVSLRDAEVAPVETYMGVGG